MAASQFQPLKIAKRVAAVKTRTQSVETCLRALELLALNPLTSANLKKPKMKKYVERKGVEGEAVEGEEKVQ